MQCFRYLKWIRRKLCQIPFHAQKVTDEKIAEWKHSWLPNLMGSEIGKWMLENHLTEYYSEQMNKDLYEAATTGQADR
jgi:hypothetical protein